MSGREVGSAESTVVSATVDRIDSVLPQTQCTRCGYPDCRGYAQAIADGAAGIDRCPPGGTEGVARLAAVTGLSVTALDPAYGQEGPRQLAVIDESWCIGCTLCLDACPTDAILGRNKRMHTVVPAHCTGCELCIPACPVDCIAMVPVTGTAIGWDAWSSTQAAVALERYRQHKQRSTSKGRNDDTAGRTPPAGKERTDQAGPAAAVAFDGMAAAEQPAPPIDPKRAMIEAAMRRARALRG